MLSRRFVEELLKAPAAQLSRGGQPGLKVRTDVFGTPYFFRLSYPYIDNVLHEAKCS